MGDDASLIDRAGAVFREVVLDGGYVAVLTGAGVSAESGVPTFRDSGAVVGGGRSHFEPLWSSYDPEVLASPEGFRRDPEAVTRWYAWRRRLVLGCEPNAGHRSLAVLERLAVEAGGRFVLATQNVDRLHQRAGSGRFGGRVVELHGTITRWRSCGEGDSIEGESLDALLSDEAAFPPRHPLDGSALRPDVVWFGEPLPSEAWEVAAEAATECDVFLVVGTSSVVYPAAGLTAAAGAGGATTVEVNVATTPMTASVDMAVRGASGEILPVFLEALRCKK